MKNTKSQLLGSLKRFYQLAQLKKKDEKLYYKLVNQKPVSINRRTFLKSTAVASIGLTVPTQIFPAYRKKQPTISIIGGGIAGLSCAHSLKKAGIFANIYEASSRIGGRMFTLSNFFSEGLTTELGGEFIDTNHMDMIRLAKEFNVDLLDSEADYSINENLHGSYYFNDKHIEESEFVEAFEAIVERLNKDRHLCGKAFDSPHCKKLDNTSLEEYVSRLECEPFLKELLIQGYTAEFGLDAGIQSSLNLIDMTETMDIGGSKPWGDSDTRYKIQGGNIHLIEKLAKSLEDNIHTGSRLASINSIGDKYNLVFENSKEVVSDFVVIAIPFTVLRKIELNIDGMTDEKEKCIKELGYGQNNKLMLGFDGRPWREGGNNSSGSLLSNPIQMGWDSGHMQNGNIGATGYTIFLGGTPSIKLGEEAKRLGLKNRISGETMNYYLSHFNSIYPNSKAQFNGKQYTATWTNNPLTKGSYSCYTVGQWTTISGHEITSINKVFFAGEHCSRDFQGFMNGGAETGRRAAEEIIKKI